MTQNIPRFNLYTLHRIIEDKNFNFFFLYFNSYVILVLNPLSFYSKLQIKSTTILKHIFKLNSF